MIFSCVICKFVRGCRAVQHWVRVYVLQIDKYLVKSGKNLATSLFSAEINFRIVR